MKLLKNAEAIYSKMLSAANNHDMADVNFHSGTMSCLAAISRSYKFNCTGDCCVGDKIVFIEAVWEKISINKFGKLANRITDFNLIEAEIIKDSYGEAKQQHTFTLKSGKNTFLKKGRVLYRYGVWRKEWKVPSLREQALAEKHARGDEARDERLCRKEIARIGRGYDHNDY